MLVSNYYEHKERLGLNQPRPTAGDCQFMTLEKLQQLAVWDPQLKKHIEKLVSKTDQEQRAWLAGWNQVRTGGKQ